MRERYIDTGCTYAEAYEPEHTYTFTGPCLVTGDNYSVTVKGPELFDFRRTGSIMMLKSLCAGDREFLITGTSPAGWEKLFGTMEEIAQQV
jgi:hypothetical protein|tara:strand:- start:57 stop:329 length:273 start_codon:yes stop_codon:yes gene_type:complete